jgi:hypothetical protein
LEEDHEESLKENRKRKEFEDKDLECLFLSESDPEGGIDS